MRVTCEVGTFEAPDGWVVLEGVGAAERAEIPDGSAETFRQSIVVCADTLPEGHDAESYFTMQQAVIPQVIPSCSIIESSASDSPGGVCRLMLQIDGTDAEVIAQWMAFVVAPPRVAVITGTALDASVGELPAHFEAAVASFKFVAPR